eukprot:4186791-Prymnesium_polylepis.1
MCSVVVYPPSLNQGRVAPRRVLEVEPRSEAITAGEDSEQERLPDVDDSVSDADWASIPGVSDDDRPGEEAETPNQRRGRGFVSRRRILRGWYSRRSAVAWGGGPCAVSVMAQGGGALGLTRFCGSHGLNL